MNNVLAEITLNALNEGEVFSGADREYAFEIRKEENHFHVWERNDSGGTSETEFNQMDAMKWLLHFPIFRLRSQIEDYLIKNGMKYLQRENLEAAFIFFSRATEHEMIMGNIGLALIFHRGNEPDKAASSFKKIPLSEGIPFTEIPVKNFLIRTGMWENTEEAVKILTELKEILPSQKDVTALLKMLPPPDINP